MRAVQLAGTLPAVWPQSRKAAERYGGDPLAMLPLERLHPCARARIAYAPYPDAELEALVTFSAKLADDDDHWQLFLVRCDQYRANLADGYRELLDDDGGGR